jgi:hypothetical protein
MRFVIALSALCRLALRWPACVRIMPFVHFRSVKVIFRPDFSLCVGCSEMGTDKLLSQLANGAGE